MVRKVKKAVALQDEEFGRESEEQLEEEDYALPAADEEVEEEDEGYELDQEGAEEPFSEVREEEF